VADNFRRVRVRRRTAARRRILLLAAAVAGACVGQHPPAVPIRIDDAARQEAIGALSGSGRGPLLSEADIQEVARGLEAIRRQEPVLRHVKGYPQRVEISVPDSVAVRLPGSERRRDTVVAATGIAPIDSVSRELRVADVAISWSYEILLQPRFTRPVDAAAARAMYMHLHQAQFPMPGITAGNYTGVGARFGDGVIHYEFGAYWGDCMAGCIHRHAWHYTWDPRTGAVRKVSEAGDPVESWIGPQPAGG
jgi:hypothetical protein